MPSGFEWRPIADIEGDGRDLTEGELRSLWRVWQRQRAELEETGGLTPFQKRLGREWSIETGIIEGVYTLDRGVTRRLIERGINAALIPHGASDKDNVLVARVIQDHYETLEGMFDFIGGERELSTGYVKELHAALLRNMDIYTVVDQFGKVFEKELEKGEYKHVPNSPTRPDGMVHEYAPPEHVASEMDALIRIYGEQQKRNVPVEVRAAWLHHRFTQIHPFSDGNGRVARALASLAFIKDGWFPVVIRRDDRARYIAALEKADSGDLRPLVELFVETQRNALVEASEIAYEVKPVGSTHDAIVAARDQLLQKGRLPARESQRSEETAMELQQLAIKIFDRAARELCREIGSLRSGFRFAVEGYEKSAIPVSLALILDSGKQEQLNLSFESIGPRSLGFVGVLAYLAMNGSESISIEGGAFQINYEEDLESAKARFTRWLDSILIKALNEWRRRL